MDSEELSAWLRRLADDVRRTKSDYQTNVVSGCPIPFFGNVLAARVLTVGVNPSDTEFAPGRQWTQPLSHDDWQKRLLTYFNWSVPANRWFETWSMCLELLHLSYAGGRAAHIDVSPRATTPMLDDVTDKIEFRRMVECDVKWFFDLLGQLPQVQLLLVAGPITRRDGKKQQLEDFIRKQAGADWRNDKPLPRLVTPSHPAGIPVFVCPFESGVDGLYSMVRHVHRNRELLLRLSAPGPNKVPIVPARLDWPSAIGSFLLAFGILEYFVFVFLKDHLPQDEFDKVKAWHLKDRLARIEAYLRENERPTAEQKKFTDLTKRLAPLRELRNHIAHGHMYWRLNEKTQERMVTLFQAKDVDTGHLSSSKHVQFLELEEALETLSELIQEFERLAGFKVEAIGAVAKDFQK